METKALPSWTTGVEPLVERPCLPTPRWTTLAGTPYSSSYLFPSFFIPCIYRCFSSFSRLFSARLRDSPILTPSTFRSLIRHGCSDYAKVSSPDHCGAAAAVLSNRYRQGRSFRSRGRRDLSKLTIAHSIVSPIDELNGETESLTSRAPFGQIRPMLGIALGNEIARDVLKKLIRCCSTNCLTGNFSLMLEQM